ncbi:MAG TPA: hypothetical protein VGP26_14050 [Actinophytocola sp.]|nr:hypothetical protein [Actinophytocola sp.]
MDAIIVPTSRSAVAVRHALDLAAELRCMLVVLCSKWSSADAVSALATEYDVDLIAVDVDGIDEGVLPRFETSQLLGHTGFDTHADTSLKRNLGLLIANAVGWQRVVFLDDDIEIPAPRDLRLAAGLTDAYAGVGLSLVGYPDNSVVCHAYREAGGDQDTFVGGGALAVGALSMTSFFPAIYNEDWFYLMGGDGALQPTSSVGTAVQRPYDPFADERRARREELGDCLAEGLFWLFDNGRSAEDADARFWQQFLRRRADFITDIVGMVQRTCDDPDRRIRMLASLRAARARCLTIEPALCVRYLDAWHADRITWRNHLKANQFADLAPGDELDAEKVVVSLGLAHSTDVVRVLQ